MADNAEALKWIVDLFRENEIPFQAVGGLAARAYGATRPLGDYDFCVPTGRLRRVARAAPDMVVRKPAPFNDGHWEVHYTLLVYDDQKIHLVGADGARFYQRVDASWTDIAIDFDASTYREVLDVEIAVMPLADLITYKQILDRPEDRTDLAEILANRPMWELSPAWLLEQQAAEKKEREEQAEATGDAPE